jgi:hypothetical protein
MHRIIVIREELKRSYAIPADLKQQAVGICAPGPDLLRYASPKLFRIRQEVFKNGGDSISLERILP